ncbi:GCN5-related N-acetyltransferase [Gloeocapsa sp. PCC 7428]|uniref:GNAT family N-acetyltransferase n=1 Tax=Gloeocapsa sp. PCC 7428 TaxID=1173026 RepID=UPI0002A5F558|nr:GNAT family N-acetyltransferase [Gloeocapsa sp. PCC 7428]AFZ30437.1 GCN5-related N-acetyltransferase [Gloeocapsa sp. PCC 7428]
MSNSNYTIRQAIAQDADEIANLSHQLGYPTTTSAVRQRLAQMHSANHAVYVAEISGIGVVGWIHAHLCLLLQTNLHAEIGGLVVDERYRGSGIGRQLLLQIEQWASQQGCESVYLRSNIIRKQAHIFYKKMGYSYIKTSLAFNKHL